MKLKHPLKEKNIDLKTVILKKMPPKFSGRSNVVLNSIDHTYKTSEKFLDIPSQPKNTCPIIDLAKENNNKMTNEISKKMQELSCARPSSDESLECCGNGTILDDNLRNLKSIIWDLDFNLKLIEEINDDLESLRSLCSSTREKGEEVKGIIWYLIEDPENKNSYYENFKKIDFKLKWTTYTYKDFELKYNKIRERLDEFNKSVYCQDSCSNEYNNNSLETLFDDAHDIKYNMPEEMEKAIDNFYLIDEWTTSLVSKFEEIYKNGIEIDLESEKSEYLKSLNSLMKSNFNEYIKDWASISLDFSYLVHPQKLDFFIQNTESLNLIKNIESFIQEYNSNLIKFHDTCIKYCDANFNDENLLKSLESQISNIMSQFLEIHYDTFIKPEHGLMDAYKIMSFIVKNRVEDYFYINSSSRDIKF